MDRRRGTELAQRGGIIGGRFYLDEVRVRGGEALELATFGGGWLRGRFAVERCPLRPVFYVALHNGAYAHFVIPEGAKLRRVAGYAESMEIGPDGPR